MKGCSGSILESFRQAKWVRKSLVEEIYFLSQKEDFLKFGSSKVSEEVRKNARKKSSMKFEIIYQDLVKLGKGSWSDPASFINEKEGGIYVVEFIFRGRVCCLKNAQLLEE